ncbi:hypothetical protein HDU78_002240 [Chytriomyces hyalinus]|nr:hypothetical protein HDU78_002240 [Chytriomyces hyalinus]
MRTPSLLNAPVTNRLGNWFEESVLREGQLKDFIAKADSGTLGIQRHEMKMMLALQEVRLPEKFMFGENVMIKNLGTNGYLSVDLPDTFPNNVTIADEYYVTTANNLKRRDGGKPVAAARSSFKLVPIDEYGLVGMSDMTPRYGMKIYIVSSDALIEKPMFLWSVPKNTAQKSRKLKYQMAFLSFEKGACAEWQIVYPDRSMRLEMEGQPVQAESPVIIQHQMTQNELGSELGTPSLIRNDFGVEYDVDLYRHRGGIWSRWEFEPLRRASSTKPTIQPFQYRPLSRASSTHGSVDFAVSIFSNPVSIFSKPKCGYSPGSHEIVLQTPVIQNPYERISGAVPGRRISSQPPSRPFTPTTSCFSFAESDCDVSEVESLAEEIAEIPLPSQHELTPRERYNLALKKALMDREKTNSRAESLLHTNVGKPQSAVKCSNCSYPQPSQGLYCCMCGKQVGPANHSFQESSSEKLRSRRRSLRRSHTDLSTSRTDTVKSTSSQERFQRTMIPSAEVKFMDIDQFDSVMG